MHQPSLLHIAHHVLHLPNGVREAMLLRGHAKGLVIVDALYHLNIAPQSWLTFNEVYRLLSNNCGTSRKLVNEGLQDPEIFQRIKAPREGKKRGRSAYLYRIPLAVELIGKFAPEQADTPTDKLHKSDFKNVTAYRMALHRELFRRLWCENDGQGFIMTRDLMAERLGVSTRTIRTYDQKLGHSNTPNYIEKRVHDHNLNELPYYKARYDENGKRLPSRYWLKVMDLENGVVKTYPYVRYLAYVAIKAGMSVFRVNRQPNTYYPYRKPHLSQFDDWDVVNHYYAEMEAIKAAGLYQDDKGNWQYR